MTTEPVITEAEAGPNASDAGPNASDAALDQQDSKDRSRHVQGPSDVQSSGKDPLDRLQDLYVLEKKLRRRVRLRRRLRLASVFHDTC